MSPVQPRPSQRKKRVQLPISREALFCIERQKWVERNAEVLRAHGKAIAQTGLAGAEFDRI